MTDNHQKRTHFVKIFVAFPILGNWRRQTSMLVQRLITTSPISRMPKCSLKGEWSVSLDLSNFGIPVISPAQVKLRTSH